MISLSMPVSYTHLALAPVQAEYGRILADKAYVDSVLKSGAERAARLANRTVSKVYRKVCLLYTSRCV